MGLGGALLLTCAAQVIVWTNSALVSIAHDRLHPALITANVAMRRLRGWSFFVMGAACVAATMEGLTSARKHSMKELNTFSNHIGQIWVGRRARFLVVFQVRGCEDPQAMGTLGGGIHLHHGVGLSGILLLALTA